MQEIIAVSHMHLFNWILITISICGLVFIPIQVILQKRELKRLIEEDMERQRRWNEKYELVYDMTNGMSFYRERQKKPKRRKDHPLTTIFRNEMPVRQ